MLKVKCIKCHYFGISGLESNCRVVKQEERDDIHAGEIKGMSSDLTYRCERGKWKLVSGGIVNGYKKELLTDRRCPLFAEYSQGATFEAKREENCAEESQHSLTIARCALVIAGVSFIVAVISIILNCKK